jgi:hypothetical protein
MQSDSAISVSPSLDDVAPTSPVNLHLLAGVWVASCPTCGYQLTSARTQERCERRAAGRRCPVCYQEP